MATQLFLGERELRSFSLEEVLRGIRRARELAGVDTLMIWSGADPTLYEPLVRACRECGVAPFLWFAVLADAQGVPIGRDELVLHCDGTRGYGSVGAWEGLGGGEEEFLFCCPNRTPSLERVFGAYTGLLQRFDFSGVMLDRIRYPSAVNGLESLFGCFCERCSERFSEMFGGSLEEQRRAAAAFGSRLSRLVDGSSVPWRSFPEVWAAAGLSDLFSFKARSVTGVVERFAAAARARGLQIGLDLYAPSLAPTVSQDYGLLSRCCDWIKPMIYCRAVGPAGLPLELACLQRALEVACPGLDPLWVGELLRGLLPWKRPESQESLLARGLPVQTIETELERIRPAELAPAVQILAGLEAIRDPGFRVDVTPAILGRALEFLRGRAEGLVASWNLLYITEDNLRAIGAFAREG